MCSAGPRRGSAAQPGALARDNSQRNPQRTASTASALMIGLALVTLVAVLAAGITSSFRDAVNDLWTDGYAITAEDNFSPIPIAAGNAAAETPGVEAIANVRGGDASVFGRRSRRPGSTRRRSGIFNLDWVEGSDAVIGALGAHGAIVDEGYAKDHDLSVGSESMLQPIGPLDPTPVPLAAGDPDPKAERALIGYTAAGHQTIQPIGSTAEPQALSTVMNTAKLGGPVVDKAGQLVGLVVGDTVQDQHDRAAREAARVRRTERRRPHGRNRAAPVTRSRGPQNAIVPELLVAAHRWRSRCRSLLGNYLTLENQHDFDGSCSSCYSKRLAERLSNETQDRRSHQTTYFFERQDDRGDSDADRRVRPDDVHRAVLAELPPAPKGQTCNRLDVRYRLVREGGQLVIDQGPDR